MTTAESNVAELLAAAVPNANVVVNGKLVHGKLTAQMARVMEWKAKFKAMPENTTDEEWNALGAEVRSDLASIEQSSMGSTSPMNVMNGTKCFHTENVDRLETLT